MLTNPLTPADRQRARELLAARTPGEWKDFADEDNIEDVRVCNIEDGRCICCLALMGNIDYVANAWDDPTILQWRADAALIAAAPALLERYEARVSELETALQELYDAACAVERQLPVATEDWHHDLFAATGHAFRVLNEGGSYNDA